MRRPTTGFLFGDTLTRTYNINGQLPDCRSMILSFVHYILIISLRTLALIRFFMPLVKHGISEECTHAYLSSSIILLSCGKPIRISIPLIAMIYLIFPLGHHVGRSTPTKYITMEYNKNWHSIKLFAEDFGEEYSCIPA